jgi:hypothetical protein
MFTQTMHSSLETLTVDCPNCGDPLREAARYCSKCGTRVQSWHISGEAARPPTQAQPSTQPVPTVRPPEERLENARVGYQAALDLWNTQAQLASSRFNVMVVANSIILATIGLAIAYSRSFPLLFTQALSIVGIVLCLVWLHAHWRASQYNNYLALSARELESNLSDSVVTVSRGASFSEGNEVTLTIDNERKRLRLSWLPRLARTESFSYFSIASFLLLYIYLLLRA